MYWNAGRHVCRIHLSVLPSESLVPFIPFRGYFQRGGSHYHFRGLISTTLASQSSRWLLGMASKRFARSRPSGQGRLPSENLARYPKTVPNPFCLPLVRDEARWDEIRKVLRSVGFNASHPP